MLKTRQKQSGYASVTLMVFVVIGITITIAATTTLLINFLSASRMQQGIIAYDVAESGMENGLLRFIRDPDNYNGESLTTENGTATISVAGDRKSITSKGVSGNFQRTIRAQIDYTDKLVISSWKEIY